MHDKRARGSCGYWHNEQKYCPNGYPYNDNDSSSYCWGLKVHIYCYACAPGYKDWANTCTPCEPGEESGAAATSCTKCGLGKVRTTRPALRRSKTSHHKTNLNSLFSTPLEPKSANPVKLANTPMIPANPSANSAAPKAAAPFIGTLPQGRVTALTVPRVRSSMKIQMDVNLVLMER